MNVGEFKHEIMYIVQEHCDLSDDKHNYDSEKKEIVEQLESLISNLKKV